MERIDKIKLAIERGYTCDPETGKVFNPHGRLISSKIGGYIVISLRDGNSRHKLKGSIFMWYWVNKEIVKCLDHINRDRSDNRICNLRSVTNQENLFNKEPRGYGWHKHTNKWRAMIGLNCKSIHLGYFKTEEEAKAAYKTAKKIYHKFNE